MALSKKEWVATALTAGTLATGMIAMFAPPSPDDKRTLQERQLQQQVDDYGNWKELELEREAERQRGRSGPPRRQAPEQAAPPERRRPRVRIRVFP